MRKFRFKTREEFRQEFGKNWRYRVSATFTGNMDHLLGVELPNQLLSRVEQLYSEGYGQTFSLSGWRISTEMLKPIGLKYSNGVAVVKNGLMHA